MYLCAIDIYLIYVNNIFTYKYKDFSNVYKFKLNLLKNCFIFDIDFFFHAILKRAFF